MLKSRLLQLLRDLYKLCELHGWFLLFETVCYVTVVDMAVMTGTYAADVSRMRTLCITLDALVSAPSLRCLRWIWRAAPANNARVKEGRGRL